MSLLLLIGAYPKGPTSPPAQHTVVATRIRPIHSALHPKENQVPQAQGLCPITTHHKAPCCRWLVSKPSLQGNSPICPQLNGLPQGVLIPVPHIQLATGQSNGEQSRVGHEKTARATLQGTAVKRPSKQGFSSSKAITRPAYRLLGPWACPRAGVRTGTSLHPQTRNASIGYVLPGNVRPTSCTQRTAVHSEQPIGARHA
jgi:hypothetical protein